MIKLLRSIIALTFILFAAQNIVLASDGSSNLQRTYMLKYINAYREMYDLNDLGVNEALTKAADSHAKYLKTNNTKDIIEDKSKTGFIGVYSWNRAQKYGYPSSLVTECVHTDYRSIKDTTNALFNDPDIRIQLLNPDNKYIGIGICDDIYVLDFGFVRSYSTKVIGYPCNNTSIYNDSNFKDKECGYSIYSNSEMENIILKDIRVKNVSAGNLLKVNGDVKIISKTKAYVGGKILDTLTSGSSYSLYVKYEIKYSSGMVKEYSNSLNFTMSKEKSEDLSLLTDKKAVYVKYKANDIKGHWAYDTIDKFQREGYIYVDSSRMYKPDDQISRGEIADIIAKALALDISSNNKIFDDIKSSNKYYKSIDLVCTNGIMQGISEDKFGGDKNLTREEAAVIIDNILNILRFKTHNNYENIKLKDLDDCSMWSQEQVKRVVSLGIIKGKDDLKFHPKEELTKAEAIILIDRLKYTAFK